jgi:hypothetical protein
VLSDGSIVKAFQTPDQTLTLSAWKAGNAAWRPIVQEVASNLAYLLFSSNDGKITLWVVSESGNNSFSVARYQQ